MKGLILRDVVAPLPEAELFTDVQLSSYRSKVNAELVRKYIFASKASAGRRSSTDLLRAACEAFVASNPNRFTFIANYGHGKSHLALVLANFFGKASDSDEVTDILAGLDHVLEENRPQYRFLKEFKRERGAFLVLTISGDNPTDLRSQFFKALEEALEEAPTIETKALPFWFAGAERFLQRIHSEMLPQVDDFLSSRDIDLRVLTKMVHERDSEAEPICVALHQYLYGTSPAFANSYSLNEAVVWAVDNLCGPERPFAGLLILFDEFSAFIQRYSSGNSQFGGAPLQDLLNGISNRRGRAAFLAFSQQDPDAIAESTLKGHFQTLDNIKKELERLPHAQRYQMHSSLEDVLDAYLRLHEDGWQQLMQMREFSREVNEAGAAAFQAFEGRYKQTLNWDRRHFDNVISKGCFPLHPMTTALLATLEVRSDPVSPRRVLGFVVESINEHLTEPAFKDDAPNWIWPVALVDYFDSTLEEEHYRNYTAALTQAGGDEAEEDHKAVLKAMLLQAAGKMESQRVGYRKVISQLSGLPEDRAEKTLKGLHGSNIIRSDPAGRFYTFWPAGMGPDRVEERLSAVLQHKSLSEQKTLDEANELLEKEGLLKSVPVEVDWGHQDDWSASQILLGSDRFDPQQLRKLTSQYLEWHPDKQVRSRGLVIRLVAENDQQVEHLRRNARDVLDSSLGASLSPLLIVRPQQPHPNLPDLLLRFYGLSSLFSNADIQHVGEVQYREVMRGAKGQLREALDQLSQSGAYEAPEFFRRKLETLTYKQEGMILREFYRMSYHKGPKKFYDYYKHTTSSNLTKAVSFVMVDLLSNKVGAADAMLKNDSVAQEILSNFLNKEWQLLDDKQRIKVPISASPLHQGWQALDNHFRVGATGMKAGPVLTELLNPPYGYDYNTLTLLFSAWYGYHHRDIVRFSIGGQTASVDQIIRDGRGNLKKPKDFLPDLGTCFITRRDITQRQRRIEELIERVQSGETLRQAEAQSSTQELEGFVKDERANYNSRREAEVALDKLEQGLITASDYDRKAEAIRRSMDRNPELSGLASLLKDARELPEINIVQASEPKPHELIKQLKQQIEHTTEQQCVKHEHLETIDDYSLHKSTLESSRVLLKDEGMHDLVDRVDRALETLQRSREKLAREEKDARVIERLKKIQAKGSLTYLRGVHKEIEALPVRSLEAGQKAREQLSSIEAEIEKLESFAANSQDRLEALTQLNGIRSFRDDLLKNFTLFEETEEQNVIEAALEKANNLEGFFRELETLQNERVQNPEQVNALLQRCNLVEEEYAGSLSQQQQEKLNKVREAIRQKEDTERQLAVEWMTYREKELSKLDGDSQKLGELIGELNAPPAFLPAEEQNRLGNCRREAQRRVDSDEVLQVEMHFRRIADPETRTECLQRLKRLIEEAESP